MQLNLPIAVCLFEHTKKKATIGSSRAPRLDIGLHQVRPDNPKSIVDYAKSGDNKDATLLHHVIFFSTLSYAECQRAVRERIASFSGACLVGKTKELIGDKDKIIKAMTEVSLDCSWLLKVQRDRLNRNYPRHAGHLYKGGYDIDPREESGSEDLDEDNDSFIATTDEESENDDSFIATTDEESENEKPAKRYRLRKFVVSD